MNMSKAIAVMNTSGVALAASNDTSFNRKKIYNLSPEVPVGIMLSGKENYLHVPWETLINIYRNKLNNKQFDTLEQYVADFLMFIDQMNYEDQSSDEAEAIFAYEAVKREVETLTSQLFTLSKQAPDHYLVQGEALLEKALNVLEKDYINEFDNSDFRLMTEKFSEEIDELLDAHLSRALMKDAWRGTIKTIVCSNVLKNFGHHTKLIFAGFGENELFPSVITVMIEGKINNKLKYAASSDLSKSVHLGQEAFVIPFSEEVNVPLLTTGIDDDLEEYSLTQMETMLGEIESGLLNDLKNQFKTNIALETIEKTIHERLVTAYQSYNQNVFDYKQAEFINPFTKQIKHLSKTELARMATSFLHLPTENNVYSTENAVVTKGDGVEPSYITF